jgi:hypothetical protein
VLIGGTADTAYQLNVDRKPGFVPEDIFEPNDSFEQATRMLFEPRKKTPFGFFRRLEWGPGIFQATLHTGRWLKFVNPDFYELEVPDSTVFRIPTVRIDNTDLPLNVTLYDEARQVIQSWPNVRKVEITPPANSTCYLKVSGVTANRYTIQTTLKVDRDALPGPLEEVDVIPKWWGDPPPLLIKELDKYFAVNVGEDRGDGRTIAFEKPEEAVSLTLLDLAGNVVRRGTEALDDRRVAVSTEDLEPGRYLLQVTRLSSGNGQKATMQLQLAPPI